MTVEMQDDYVVEEDDEIAWSVRLGAVQAVAAGITKGSYLRIEQGTNCRDRGISAEQWLKAINDIGVKHRIEYMSMVMGLWTEDGCG